MHPSVAGLAGVPTVKQLSVVHCAQSGLTHSSAPMVTVGVQAPALQESPVVQELPSSQLVPSAASGSVHAPVAGWQTPAAWHTPLGVQVFTAPPEHVPATQASPVVHRLLSLHAVPLAAAGFEQAPEVGSQLPATWH